MVEAKRLRESIRRMQSAVGSQDSLGSSTSDFSYSYARANDPVYILSLLWERPRDCLEETGRLIWYLSGMDRLPVECFTFILARLINYAVTREHYIVQTIDLAERLKMHPDFRHQIRHARPWLKILDQLRVRKITEYLPDTNSTWPQVVREWLRLRHIRLHKYEDLVNRWSYEQLIRTRTENEFDQLVRSVGGEAVSIGPKRKFLRIFATLRERSQELQTIRKNLKETNDVIKAMRDLIEMLKTPIMKTELVDSCSDKLPEDIITTSLQIAQLVYFYYLQSKGPNIRMLELWFELVVRILKLGAFSLKEKVAVLNCHLQINDVSNEDQDNTQNSCLVKKSDPSTDSFPCGTWRCEDENCEI